MKYRRPSLWSDIISLRKWLLSFLNTWMTWGREKEVPDIWVSCTIFDMLKANLILSLFSVFTSYHNELLDISKFWLMRCLDSEKLSPHKITAHRRKFSRVQTFRNFIKKKNTNKNKQQQQQKIPKNKPQHPHKLKSSQKTLEVFSDILIKVE